MTKTAPLAGHNDVVYGTPRTLPTVLLCQADINFCGRHWIANDWGQYDKVIKERQVHEVLCSSRSSSAGLISVLGEAVHQGLVKG